MTKDEMVFWAIVIVLVLAGIYYCKLVPRGWPVWQTTVPPMYDATGEGVDLHNVPYNWVNPGR